MTRSTHIVDALHAAFCLLADEESELGRKVRAELATSTGLSLAMVEWGLRTSLPTNREVLVGALHQAPLVAQRRVAVVLSGNLFTACIRALGWPLLLGATVTAKAASQDDVLPHALREAIQQVAPDLATYLDVRTFDRNDENALHALVADCDVVSAYGSDATLDAIDAALPPGASLIRHGHGVGVLYVAASALESARSAQGWADRVALDIAAYDQRGCLSPHVVFAQEGCVVTPEAFVAALAVALGNLEHTLPRGTLSEHDVIAQSQWRGLMAATANLTEGPSFGVARMDSDVTPPSFTAPGYRNVCVVTCADIAALMQQVTPLGEHLKCIGVAGSEAERLAVNTTLPPSLRPIVCRAGTMQTPAFDSRADGELPWHGVA